MPSNEPSPHRPAPLTSGDTRFIIGSIALLAFFAVILVGAAWITRTPIATSAEPAFKERPAADPMMTAIPQLNDLLAGPLRSQADPSAGPDDAPVTLTIFSDVTCWYCGETVRAALAIQRANPETVRVVHKDFPAANKSYASYQGAIAARCAQQQGLFWELADKLYEHYDQITDERITALADDLPQLDRAKFKECRAGRIAEPVTALIDDNITEADALELPGVPAVYVNDKALFGQADAEELEAAVTQMQNAKR